MTDTSSINNASQHRMSQPLSRLRQQQPQQQDPAINGASFMQGRINSNQNLAVSPNRLLGTQQDQQQTQSQSQFGLYGGVQQQYQNQTYQAKMGSEDNLQYVGGINQNNSGDNYYADTAKKIYQIGRQEGWSQEKIFQMLKDPQAFYKYLDNVDRDSPKKKKPSALAERLHNEHQMREQKRNDLAEMKKIKEDQEVDEMKQQSVHFNAVNRLQGVDGSQGIRTHDQFLADQVMHEKKKFDRMEKQLQYQETTKKEKFNPKINPKSAKMVSTRQSQALPAHDRLFHNVDSRKQEGMEKAQEGNKNSQHTFQPQINKKSQNLKREQKVEIVLSQDAQRRIDLKKNGRGGQAQNLNTNQQTDLRHNAIKKENGRQFVSETSQLFLIQRYVDEFEQTVQQFVQEEQGKLNKDSVGTILFRLGFLTESQLDQQLLEDFYPILNLHNDTDIYEKEHLKILLAGVLNLEADWIMFDHPSDKNQTNRQIDYRLTRKEITNLNRHFKRYLQNRQDHLMRLKKQNYDLRRQAHTKQEETTFKPKLDKKSQRIDMLSRQSVGDGQKRMASANNGPGKKDRVTMLLEKSKNYQQKKEVLQYLKEQEDLQDCTFKPQILGHGKRNQQEFENQNPASIFDKLHNQKFENQNYLRGEGRHEDEIQYSKNQEEYRFKPVKYRDQLKQQKRNQSARPFKSENKSQSSANLLRQQHKNDFRETHNEEQLQKGLGKNIQFQNKLRAQQQNKSGRLSTSQSQQRVNSRQDLQFGQQQQEYEKIVNVELKIGSVVTNVEMTKYDDPDQKAIEVGQQNGFDQSVITQISAALRAKVEEVF